MRSIERKMIDAIVNEKEFASSNTWVEIDESPVFRVTLVRVYLFGNLIAMIDDMEMTIFDCGYRNLTTKSRLNTILSHFNLPLICQYKFEWYIGDEEWTGIKKFSLQKPKSTDAVLGNNVVQPKPYDVVLGGN